MDLIITAFTLGLISNLHCLGMCGPIALVLPIHKKPFFIRLIGIALYNTGRISTYLFIGLIFGLFGQGISAALTQQFVSISLGTIIILSVIFPRKITSKLNPSASMGRAYNYLKIRLGKLLHNYSLYNLFLIGLFNGLLPCGMVYAAVGGSIASGSLINGTLFMLFFGLGTLPIMFFIPLFPNLIPNSVRNKFKSLLPFFLVLMGLLFILRGLNLNIPYLSPKINVARPFVQDCVK